MENKNYTVETVYKSKRTGGYYTTPEKAEKAGLCNCGNEKKEAGIFCDSCQEKHNKKTKRQKEIAFYQRSVKKWDNTVECVFDENTDEWFYSDEEVTDHYEFKVMDLADAKLIEGVPHYLSRIEEDYWDEDLAEDYELPQGFLDALDKLNEIASKTFGCYYPGTYRIEIQKP